MDMNFGADCTLGYNDFDFFDKMGPPRPEIDVKWILGHIYNYVLAVSSDLGFKLSKKC
jgi:hypothetical protein